METQAATLPRVFSFGFWKILCKGTGQVMFQDNAWTGLFFLAGIFYGSYVTGNPAVAWGALAGVFMSTITGYLLRYPAEKGTAGPLGIQRGFGRMCLTDIFRECTLNVVGHCYLFLYDNLGDGRIEPFIGSL